MRPTACGASISPPGCPSVTSCPSRVSRIELHRLVIERGVTDASASTIWRWLHEDAIKPWQTRSWMFPRDCEPDFAGKPGRALDLSPRTFEGKRLHLREYVIGADEKTQLQPLGQRPSHGPAGTRPAGADRVRVLPAAARSAISPPRMCATPSCLTASSKPRGSSRSAGSSIRSRTSSPPASRSRLCADD